MPVAEIAGSKEERRRLWSVRLAGMYCIALGVLHLFGFSLVLYQTADTALSIAPWWLYAVSFAYPLSRIAAGFFLLKRLELAVPVVGLLVFCAAFIRFIWPSLWASQTGEVPEIAPIYTVLSRVDFVLLLVIFWATFKWKAQGVLISNKAMHAT